VFEVNLNNEKIFSLPSFGYPRQVQHRPTNLPISLIKVDSAPRQLSVEPLYRHQSIDSFCDKNVDLLNNQYEVPFVYNVNRIDPQQHQARQNIHSSSLRQQQQQQQQQQHLNPNSHSISKPNIGQMQKPRSYMTYRENF
jgi:hypothetical protein